MTTLWGGIEAGGTKFVAAIGTGPDEILAEDRFPTTTPAETLARTIGFLREQVARFGQLAAIGVGSFGPVDPDPASSQYGFITTTPKPGWKHTDVVGPLRAAFNVPVGFDTDVNGAVLGEARWGAARGLANAVYFTIGTGIGGGAIVNGKLAHGLVHPEMGHMLLRRDPARDPYRGHCPYHGDCWEGLAAGPALEERFGVKAETFGLDHPAWTLEAHYVAQALLNVICVLSPERIILGGGVMGQTHLFPLIRSEVQTLLNGYVQHDAILKGIDDYIVPPGLGTRSGILGAFALAEQALNEG
jgi:fructokinase